MHPILKAIDAVEKVTSTIANYTFGERRPGDLPVLVESYEKMKKMTGWEPKNQILRK